MTIEEVKEKIIPILKQADVEYAGVFGSVARGEARTDSDIDLVVRFSPHKQISLVGLVGLEQTLTDLLDKKVQLLTEKSVHPYIKPQVSKDLKVLYGERQDL